MDFYLKAASSRMNINGSPFYLNFKAWYHGASIGDESILGDAYFVDQLHVLGRALSRDLGDHAAAVRVFKTCTELDSDDDYGHHYYAYNLDCLAEKRKEVSSSYQRAIQLNESHPWWWSRWINYLITTGNMRDAKIEWAKASENLGSKSGKAEEWVYTALHLWVARLALHRAQLDFVSDVLEDVPTSLMQVDTRFQAIRHHLEAMQIARESESVFPINIAPGTYWEKPHLDLPLTSQEGKRVNWYPARIAFVNKEFVGLIAGKHDSTSGRTDYGMVDLTRTLFDDASMDEKSDVIEEGRFVEIGFYGANEVMRIRVHPNEDFLDPNLPDFDPPNPRRYLDKQIEVA
jgi:tetratricopeptide (TPR) repeat protein